MASLSIGEVAARTGVAESTLRMWEARHGFPDPERGAGGQRRYSETDVIAIRDVLRGREEGLSLVAAIVRAARPAARVNPSIFRAIRERFDHLHPVVMSKPALLRLTYAIEDECCARATDPILFGLFQEEKYYRRSQARWQAFSRGAGAALVLADFPELTLPADGPVEVPIGLADPLLQEWCVVCEAAELPACVIGWERPAPDDRGRWFEAMWTVEPEVVHEAARVCAQLVARRYPDLVAGLEPRLAVPSPLPDVRQLRAAVALATRVTAYVSERYDGPRPAAVPG